MITGAWKSTPIQALYCEAGILPPDIQKDLICSNFLTKLLSSSEDHPIRDLYNRDSWLVDTGLRGKQYKSPLYYRVINSPLSQTLSDLFKLLKPDKFTFLPPWQDLTSSILGESKDQELSKSAPRPDLIFKNMIELHFPNSLLVYTDGSLIANGENKVGASMVIPSKNQNYRWKLQPHHSILSAELFAIQKATSLTANNPQPVTIFTDSQAALSLLSSIQPKSYKTTVNAIQNNLLSARTMINIHWVPGHSAIKGNELADKQAKLAAQSSIPYSKHFTEPEELKNVMKRESINMWKKRWNLIKGGLHIGNIILEPNLQHKPLNSSREMEVIFSQCRLGKTRLNAALYKIKQVDSPLCEHCTVEETVYHFFLVCKKYDQHRDKLSENLKGKNIKKLNLKDLLYNPDTIIEVERFIRSSERFKK